MSEVIDKLLSEAEAAAIAGVNFKTIQKLVRSGRIKAADFGTGKKRLYRIHPDDLRNIAPVAPAGTAETPAPEPRVQRRPRARTAESIYPRV